MGKPHKRDPRWTLGDSFGLDVDNYCWHLWFRARDKDGNPSGWSKRRKYYASLGQLFANLQIIIEREVPEGQDILPWAEASFDSVQKLSDELVTKLKAEGLYDVKRPVSRLSDARYDDE